MSVREDPTTLLLMGLRGTVFVHWCTRSCAEASQKNPPLTRHRRSRGEGDIALENAKNQVTLTQQFLAVRAEWLLSVALGLRSILL